MLNFINPFGIDEDREAFILSVNRKAGKGNWFWVFKVGKQLWAYELGMQLYEDAYWLFLRKDIGRIKELLANLDVFVYNRHDLDSGLDYRKQTQPGEHYSDIAIRRCMRRFGIWFKGTDIFDISKTQYADRKVPFHLPHLVSSPDKSAKSWIDSNRLIVRAREVEDKCKLAEILVK